MCRPEELYHPSNNNSNNSSKRRRSMPKQVSFAPLVQIRIMENNRNNGIAKSELWQTKAEMKANRIMDLQIAGLMKGTNDPRKFAILLDVASSNDWTIRGLEQYANPAIASQRRRNKIHGTLFVMLEQERQYHEETEPNPLSMRKEYRRATQHCQNAAHQQGLLDAQEVRVMIQTSPPVNPQSSKETMTDRQSTTTLMLQSSLTSCAA